MIYQSNIDSEAKSARVKLEYFIKEGKAFELKEKKMTRTVKANRALHLYFSMMATHLNDLGLEFRFDGLNIGSISMMYTPELVKEVVWRPIQVALHGYKSTTDLNAREMNEIIDVIMKFFGERGVYVEFPNKKELEKRAKEEAENNEN